MFKSALFAGLTSMALMASPAFAANITPLDLEPTINGSVSSSGVFPSQEMEDAFQSYLRWTDELGLSRLTAFEALVNDNQDLASLMPGSDMQKQFDAYMQWVEANNLSPFYAFAAGQ